VIKSNYDGLTELHAAKIMVTTAHIKTSHSLVAASNSKRSPSSVFLKCPQPQLPAYHFSQLQLSVDSQPQLKVKVRVTLQLEVYHQSVCLVVKPLETHDQRLFFQLNPCGHSPYVTSSLTRRWVCLLLICLAFRQVYISHIEHVIENSSFCTIYNY
jgi:hypothetical protein